jgi:hypothetical protein
VKSGEIEVKFLVGIRDELIVMRLRIQEIENIG